MSVTNTSAPREAATGSDSTLTDPPVNAARFSASAITTGSGSKPSGALIVTCIPAVAPPSANECAMLFAPSPR